MYSLYNHGTSHDRPVPGDARVQVGVGWAGTRHALKDVTECALRGCGCGCSNCTGPGCGCCSNC